MGKGLLGPNGGSGGKFEGRFGEHCGGNGGIGGSMSGVGEGKDESMGGMGGGSLARRSMVSNDGRGGGGLVIAGGRSSHNRQGIVNKARHDNPSTPRKGKLPLLSCGENKW
ncbi:hypothetical protein Tco_1058499 [Tanacetum coccineum]|uniref:Uncharacterized protein n=1 Tax=Tanacetum coccineum TaxID=301880 RepID=A0ABQ5HA89_9ASTR